MAVAETLKSVTQALYVLQALSKELKDKGGPSVTHLFHLAFQGKLPAHLCN